MNLGNTNYEISETLSKLKKFWQEKHCFDLQEVNHKLQLNFYQKVKLINYIRRQVSLVFLQQTNLEFILKHFYTFSKAFYKYFSLSDMPQIHLESIFLAFFCFVCFLWHFINVEKGSIRDTSSQVLQTKMFW